MNRKVVLVGAWLAAAGLGWQLLGCWIVAGGERLLLLTPPFFFTGWLLAAENGWRDVRPHLRPLALLFAMIAVVVVASVVFVPFYLGAATSFFRWEEAVLAIYFVCAALLLLGTAWWLLRLMLQGIGRLLFADRADRRAAWLECHVPAVIVGLLAIPYLLAAVQVHRFKLPNRTTPRVAYGRVYEDVEFAAADGLKLRGWFVPARSPSPRTLLACHGLSNCRSGTLGYLPLADELAANLFIFDLRGHGDSDGHTVTFGYQERHDVCAAVAWLREHKSGETRELIGLGVSMGAATLVGGAALVDPPFDALVIDSSFASVHGVAENVVGGLPESVRLGLAAVGVPASSLLTGCPLGALRPVDWIGHVRAPVAIIHAKDDQLIPAAHAQQLYERACEPKTLWIADTGGGHCSTAANTAAYFARIRTMLDEVRVAKSARLP